MADEVLLSKQANNKSISSALIGSLKYILNRKSHPFLLNTPFHF